MRVIDDAFAEERAGVEPAQPFAQARDAADDDDRRRPDLCASDVVGDRWRAFRAPYAGSGRVPSCTTATGVVAGEPVLDQLLARSRVSCAVAIRSTSVRCGSASFAQSSVDAVLADLRDR